MLASLARCVLNRLAPHFELSEALAIDARKNHVKMHKDAGFATVAGCVHGVDRGVNAPDHHCTKVPKRQGTEWQTP